MILYKRRNDTLLSSIKHAQLQTRARRKSNGSLVSREPVNECREGRELISTSITGRREISAAFISDVIDAYGGPAEFYRDIYLGAVSPHGYVRDGVNMNFYDTPELRASVVPYAVTCMQKQIKAGLRTDVVVVLGSGALRKVVEREIRSAVGLKHVVYLEHPRFVMQYRRSQRGAYVDRYVSTFRSLFTP